MHATRRVSAVRVCRAFFVVALIGSVTGCSYPNAGAYSQAVTGRVTNAAGTCVLTVGSTPWSNQQGILCTNTRFGHKGECVSFIASNSNAATTGLAAVGDVRQVASSECNVNPK
jgi:hypothetical protein